MAIELRAIASFRFGQRSYRMVLAVDLNPYLALAAQIAARSGIEQKLELEVK
jgi:hypothetical protein